MACPYCGCKVHYQYTDGDAYAAADDEGHERCAACGDDFYLEDAADDEDDCDVRAAAAIAQGAAQEGKSSG